MIIENSFVVDVPPDRALSVLTDVPRVAPCIPGVTLDTVDEDGTYHGTASVRLGPVALSFSGTARIEQIDQSANTARVVGQGADSKGRGRAGATVDFQVVGEGDRSRIDVTTDLTLTGAVAQYGRASGLIKEVANQIIGEFTTNLEADIRSGTHGQQPSDSAPQEGTADSTRQISGLAVLWRALLALFSKGR